MAAEEESFVTIGTAFDVPDEDAPKKKAIPVHEQFATDTEGRRRFHGAFTGGFSAGYFNTVGSKEGWKPSTFVSSRLKRFESSRQKPEDFMDDEDLGEFGIAPRNVETTKLFAREHAVTLGKRSNETLDSTSGASFDSMMRSSLQDLVVPCRMSIGVKLLKRMGWKEGQGVGPRVRQLPKKKVYGCALPSDNDRRDGEYDIYAVGLLFAPKNTGTIKFTPKDNLHGIGYKGMLTPSPIEFSKPGFSGNLKIKGQAFGVGAFEDDDEDVYTQDSIANYDIELHDKRHFQSDRNRWTGPPGLAIEGGGLSLFAKGSKARQANKIFPPPSIPRGYQPFANVKETYECKEVEISTAQNTSTSRGKALGEQPLPKTAKSVFDLVSKDDRERIASIRKTMQSNPDTMKDSSQDRSTNSRGNFFQPFAKDPAKQARYDCFLEFRKTGVQANPPPELRSGLTEWERVREKEEFSRAAMLYQPLKGDMAARFTTGQILDTQVNNKEPHTTTQNASSSVEEKAAEKKVFGKLTRKTFEWHPAKLLCKRFNIAEPYPTSSQTGLRVEKKEKFTLGHLFGTSHDENTETNFPNKRKSASDNSTVESTEKVGFGSAKKTETFKSDSTSETRVLDEQKGNEKPSMDLFKAIFASSSEDESGNSENENVADNKSADLGKSDDTDKIDVIDEKATQEPSQRETVISHKSNIELTDTDELEYGPRPPPSPLKSQKEDNAVKLTIQSRQTVPFSRYDSDSESDSDKTKKKHKRKQKHKSKHKNKHKDRDKLQEKCQRPKTNLETTQTSKIHQRSRKSEQHKEIPDDKEILSKLKAVQKRRLCAADFM